MGGNCQKKRLKIRPCVALIPANEAHAICSDSFQTKKSSLQRIVKTNKKPIEMYVLFSETS